MDYYDDEFENENNSDEYDDYDYAYDSYIDRMLLEEEEEKERMKKNESRI